MQGKKESLQNKVQYLKGVGPKKARQLEKLGIRTVLDLLYYLPKRYEDRRDIIPINNVEVDKLHTIKGKIKRHGIWKTKKGMLVYEMVVSDDTGSIYGVWYNQPYLKKHFNVGQDIILYGKVERFAYLQMTHPDYEILKKEENAAETINMGRIVPIYPLTKDVTQRYLRSIIYKGVEGNASLMDETIPTNIRARNRLADVIFALNNIHFPNNFDSLKMAYRRIVFEEFFVLEATLALVKKSKEKNVKKAQHESVEGLFEDFKSMLPFNLTKDQEKSIKSIEKDMTSKKHMNRLIQGEVGSGKTVVAMYALLLAIRNGFQGIIMVPTEILAQQHYLTISEFFMSLNINVRLLVGQTGKNTREEIKKEFASGSANIIIGTHSLIEEDVSFDKVGVVIIDEQHKFGVSQRQVLKKKCENSDVMIMTATPIPRTLALTVYGDLEVSEIREMPKDRQPVSTYWIEESRKDKVYKFINEEVASGHQAYIVCPRIEEKGDNDLVSAKAAYEHLRKDIFPKLKLALIHGKMKPTEKDKIMSDFKKNKINILISTTVIEVGIDIPNATMMVIEDADRFGLAQLHQLRGRIGRSALKSYCILIADPENENARKRLEAFERLESGFELAEEDLEIRGQGQILGTKQHGLPEIKFGDMVADKDILELARKEAFELVERDGGLKDERNRNLRELILGRYKGKAELLNVG